MPELPEMQALGERILATYGDKTLTRIDVMQFSALKTFDPPPESLYGATLSNVSRRGKFLILDLGESRLLFHLSQGGRVDFETPRKATRPKGSVARLVFDGDALLIKEFGTERKAALWVLSSGDQGPLAALGPEPYSDDFEEALLASSDGRRLHTVLRDQRFVAGIGRGFADDILHAAELSPFSSLKSLSSEQRRDLVRTIRAILDEGLREERKRKGGLPPKLGDRFAIHKRHGQPCPRCGSELHRVWYESHEIAYCPSCQTGGKVLADRRLSRILK